VAPVIHLSDRARPSVFPRPRFYPTTNGTVILALVSGGEFQEEHLDLRAARALLGELADAVATAEWLGRIAKEDTHV
jgi:hypothetical protein